MHVFIAWLIACKFQLMACNNFVYFLSVSTFYPWPLYSIMGIGLDWGIAILVQFHIYIHTFSLLCFHPIRRFCFSLFFSILIYVNDSCILLFVCSIMAFNFVLDITHSHTSSSSFTNASLTN